MLGVVLLGEWGGVRGLGCWCVKGLLYWGGGGLLVGCCGGGGVLQAVALCGLCLCCSCYFQLFFIFVYQFSNDIRLFMSTYLYFRQWHRVVDVHICMLCSGLGRLMIIYLYCRQCHRAVYDRIFVLQAVDSGG